MRKLEIEINNKTEPGKFPRYPSKLRAWIAKQDEEDYKKILKARDKLDRTDKGDFRPKSMKNKSSSPY